MLTTTKTGISRFIENCVSQGMKHVVCSPGSRNAALLIAIDNHPEIETTVVPDERSAAFFAMGIAQQIKAPVGVVCTSGSAMLNYYPAVAEAFYQCIPLVVISADRPQEWINHGDGQTIVQSGVYANHIRAEVQIEELVEEADFKDFDTSIVHAFEKATGDWKGPIHFNCPITEPMYDTIELEKPDVPSKYLCEEVSLSENQLAELKKSWNQSSKRLILCGQMDPNPAVLNALIDLSEDASVAILVENTSNLIHPKFNHCIDRSLGAISPEEIDDFQPDFLITIGGAIISKRIKSFLRNAPIQAHWKIGAAFPEMDTYRKLTHAIAVSPTRFLTAIPSINNSTHVSRFGWKWKQKDFLVQETLPAFIDQAPYSDFSVFEVVLDCIPDGANLHMANSSVVRYGQLFDPVKTIRYFANRGTSGIDGSSSTAAGASFAAPNDFNVLITGDLSFFYDSNAFWNQHLTGNLKVVVINNGGGGIFRIIDGPSKVDQLERYFETEQNASVSGICQAYEMNYLQASNIEEVESGMIRLLTENESDRPTVFEIFTPNEINPQVLTDFFKHIKRS